MVALFHDPPPPPTHRKCISVSIILDLQLGVNLPNNFSLMIVFTFNINPHEHHVSRRKTLVLDFAWITLFSFIECASTDFQFKTLV